MTGATASLTKAQRCALEVFFLNKGRGFRSNFNDVAKRKVYWQSIDRLAKRGLIEPADGRPSTFCSAWSLTEAGWDEGGRIWRVSPDKLAAMKAEVGT